MSVKDLDLILNKEAIIATFPASFLAQHPQDVELVYRTHAKTHLPLGDTTKHVQTIQRWVTGQNKGAFVGAVVGDYGHGKTSFQIHVWDQCTQHNILSIPPFSWHRVSDITEGISSWAEHVISGSSPGLVQRMKELHEFYREKTATELAETIAKIRGEEVDKVLSYLRSIDDMGALDISTAPAKILDYCSELSGLVKEAGFEGLLVLLDEPEQTALGLSTSKVAQILFELTTGLLQREGDFGFFISMPERFLASAQQTYPALTARLQGRKCMPRLRDIYGSGFAEDLWSRYVQVFGLEYESPKIVAPEALAAIGQIGSSDRNDLSYGPRTVVSAFGRMIKHYLDLGAPYRPSDLVDDVLNQEIFVAPDYATRIRSYQDSCGAEFSNLKVLAAFPNGVGPSEAEALGLDPTILEDSRRQGITYKRMNVYGPSVLRKSAQEASQRDELLDTVEDILREYAPNPGSFAVARDAFITHLLPRIFPSRQGQQLVGWDLGRSWSKPNRDGVRVAEFVGAFRQTEREYPGRRIAVAVGPLSRDLRVSSNPLEGDSSPDLVVQIDLRWSAEMLPIEEAFRVTPGNASKGETGLVKVCLNMAELKIPTSVIENLPDWEEDVVLSLMGTLFLVGEMGKRTLSHEAQGQWEAYREVLARETLSAMVAPALRDRAREFTNMVMTGSLPDLIGNSCLWALRSRYPNYSTLIRQPQWEKKVQEYILVLQNQSIPRQCKRGRTPWVATKEEAAKAFNSTVTGLSDSFAGYENLLTMRTHDGKLQVDFMIHPLEQAIVDEIKQNSRSPLAKMNSKECWWLSFQDVAEILTCSGYRISEIKKIVDIGTSRASFHVGEHQGKQILYCVPIDPEELRAALRGKLQELKDQVTEFVHVPDYQSSVDTEQLAKDIEEVQDDAQADSVVSRIDAELLQNASRLPSFFDRLGEAVDSVAGDSREIRRLLQESRMMASIQTSITGSSGFCSDLNLYIRTNLLAAVTEIDSSAERIIASCAKARKTYMANHKGSVVELAKALAEGWELLERQRDERKALKSRVSSLERNLSEYDCWRRLLVQSDELYDKILELKKDPVHQTRAQEFLGQLTGIWKDISKHLETRNTLGLGSHKQFAQQIQAVDESRAKYLSQLGTAFNKRKAEINQMLEQVDLSERVAEVYNPADDKGSYARVYSRAVNVIREALEVEMQEIQDQVLNVLYLRDVAGRLQADKANPLLSDLEKALSVVSKMPSVLDVAWVESAVSDEVSDNGSLVNIRSAIRGSRNSVRAAVTLVRSLPRSEQQLTASASNMLQIIPRGEPIDLKLMVLKLMETGVPSSEVLDLALQSLSELFKQERVVVRVELPKR